MNALKTAALGIAAATTLAAAALPATPASAQQLCFVHGDAIEQLRQEYGESVTARGLTEDGKAMLEVLSSEQGSWTLLMTDVEGRSCVIAAGQAWTEVKALPGRTS